MEIKQTFEINSTNSTFIRFRQLINEYYSKVQELQKQNESHLGEDIKDPTFDTPFGTILQLCQSHDMVNTVYAEISTSTDDHIIEIFNNIDRNLSILSETYQKLLHDKFSDIADKQIILFTGMRDITGTTPGATITIKKFLSTTIVPSYSFPGDYLIQITTTLSAPFIPIMELCRNRTIKPYEFDAFYFEAEILLLPGTTFTVSSITAFDTLFTKITPEQRKYRIENIYTMNEIEEYYADRKFIMVNGSSTSSAVNKTKIKVRRFEGHLCSTLDIDVRDAGRYLIPSGDPIPENAALLLMNKITAMQQDIKDFVMEQKTLVECTMDPQQTLKTDTIVSGNSSCIIQ
jgi:hypothetical protein